MAGAERGSHCSPGVLVEPTSASSTVLSLRTPAISCCVLSKCMRTCPNCVAGREKRAQCWWGGSSMNPLPRDAPSDTMPLSPTSPQPLTLLVQVPDGHHPLCNIGQGAGHGVPVLHHLIDLVDLRDGPGLEGGVSAVWRGGSICPPPCQACL